MYWSSGRFTGVTRKDRRLRGSDHLPKAIRVVESDIGVNDVTRQLEFQIHQFNRVLHCRYKCSDSALLGELFEAADVLLAVVVVIWKNPCRFDQVSSLSK